MFRKGIRCGFTQHDFQEGDDLGRGGQIEEPDDLSHTAAGQGPPGALSRRKSERSPLYALWPSSSSNGWHVYPLDRIPSSLSDLE